MDEAFVLPNLKADAEMRKHVQPMAGLYRRLIVVVLNVMRCEDVFAIVEERHAVEGQVL